MNFANRIKTIRLEPDDSGFVVAAGSSDVSSEYVDTAGFDGVRFLIGFGAITSGAATSIKVQQCDTSGGSYADLEGTAQTVADTNDNKCFSVEITHPRERYLKVKTLRATQNSAIDFLVAELFNVHGPVPVTQHATVVGSEIFDAPAEGTA